MKTQNIFLNVLLLSAFLFAQGQAGKIAFFVGDVSVQKSGAGEWAKAKINQPVDAGDAVKTGKASRCEVALSEDRVLRLSENTSVTVTAPENGPASSRPKPAASGPMSKKSRVVKAPLRSTPRSPRPLSAVRCSASTATPSRPIASCSAARWP